MSDLPEPMTPQECDLRGMPFMPLEVVRVLQSTLFAKATGDEFKAAFALWCASWLEVPAASLPNDEEMLEFFSRSKTWKKVRARALHGWILCADGRLYHAIIAKNALEAWDRRLDYQETSNNKTERQRRWRERCKQLSDQLREMGFSVPRGASLEALEKMLADATRQNEASTQASTQASTVDDVEIGKTGTETVKGQGQLKAAAEATAKTVAEKIGPVLIGLRALGVNAAPTQLQKPEWQPLLEHFDVEEIVNAARLVRQRDPSRAFGVQYLIPILREQMEKGSTTPTPTPRKANGSGKFDPVAHVNGDDDDSRTIDA